MYKITKEQKEQIHKALIIACDNGTLDEFTKKELKKIEIAEKLVNNLIIPDVNHSLNVCVICEKGVYIDNKCNTCGAHRLFNDC